MKKVNNVDIIEIDITGFLRIIWNGKFKIFAAVAISVICLFIYLSDKTEKFTAKTEIMPISDYDLNEYIVFNELIHNIEIYGSSGISPFIDNDRFKITKDKLKYLYLESLVNKTIFEDAFRKFNLIDPKVYNSVQDYNEAVIKLASEIKIITPTLVLNNTVKKAKDLQITFDYIEFRYDDVQKWKQILRYVHKNANQRVHEILSTQFEKQLQSIKIKKKFKKEDLLSKKKNLIIKYETSTKNKIAFLKEHASMARTLKIQDNIYNTDNVNVNAEAILRDPTLYYLRGYLSIEKEIELLNSRASKSKFINELIFIDNEILLVSENKTLERFEENYLLTPLANKKNFVAASLKITKFYSVGFLKNYFFAIVFGVIIGLLYIVIDNTFSKRKKKF
tara:strand:- start:148 stop:1323 length:1176 start_codon:yes stop_codon:yes gene_type:complete